MTRRVSATGTSTPHVHDDNTLLRQQLSRHTQLRLQTRRRQTIRLHNEALIRNAQHVIPHAVKTDNKRAGRQLLLTQLAQRMPETAKHAVRSPHPTSPHAHHPLADPQPEQVAPFVPLAISDREQGHQGGSGSQEPEQQSQHDRSQGTEPGRDDAPDAMAARPARPIIRSVTAGRANTRRTLLSAATDLQQFLAEHSRTGSTDGLMIAKAWAEALLNAVGNASPPRNSASDAALGCLDDLLAGWERHGELLKFNPGAVLPQFLPVLRAHVPPPRSGADRPYALLPLMLINGFRNRNRTELKSARVRIHNQRLARLAPWPR